MSIVNHHSIILARVKTANGNVRHVARILSKTTRTGQRLGTAYTFTTVPMFTRDEVIMDLDQRLGYGTYPEVRHA